ncbi:hypothetical protein [Microbulbifer sp. TRSA005]|uniref:hypothetical protein n=1 Tax=Microbulbifer sp. TRSA005 TaxID=3243383 RepID=UPI004039F324
MAGSLMMLENAARHMGTRVGAMEAGLLVEVTNNSNKRHKFARDERGLGPARRSRSGPFGKR